MTEKGRCLASQEIREMIKRKKIVSSGKIDKKQIKPSTFEPTVGENVFVITDSNLFRPANGERVEEALARLNKSDIKEYDIRDGFDLHVGFSYLFPLRERPILDPLKNERIRSSTRSSFGRMFYNIRTLSSGNSRYETLFPGHEATELDLWLFVQPQAFNGIIRTGDSLTHSKILTGYDPRLTDAEIKDAVENNPILWDKYDEGKQADHVIDEGLELNLDLLGWGKEGIVALKTKKNPEEIDFREIGKYEPLEFFEPVRIDSYGGISIGNEHCLFSSWEYLTVPENMNAELVAHSPVGFIGPLHRAGFVNNGHKGPLVFEITPYETVNIHMRRGMKMPISYLNFYRTAIPDVSYSKTGYFHEQRGICLPKQFKQIDWDNL
ncbi:MAG: 2'-deoxycytidine 5'-triphosphate deaminase [Nanoarchaeota archaeon]